MKQYYAFRKISRRHALGLIGGGVALTAIDANATPDEVATTIRKLTGGAKATADGITIDVPEIAENGNAVRVSFSVDSPMTADNHVRSVTILAEENPAPVVGQFNFTPACGVCQSTTRMRLAATQKVTVLAELSDGTYRRADGKVKVTVGGCGG